MTQYLHNIKGPERNSTTNPQEINKLFEKFYKKLYSQQPNNDEAARKFLNELFLLTSHRNNANYSNAPITTQKINHMISNLAKGKAPGPDGFTADCYQITKTEMVPPLIALFGDMWEGKGYFTTGKEAYIKVIPKKDEPQT